MVERSSALGRVEDSSLVALEDRSVGLDGDGDWSLLDGGLEGSNGFGSNGVVGGGRDVSGDGLAGSVFGGVWPLSLGGEWVGLGVGKSIGLPSTTATRAGGGAGNNLLLREAQELSLGNLVVSLDGGDSREGPAGSALTLVLDGVDGSLGSPVDGSGDGGVEVSDDGVSWELLWSLVSEHSLELSIGPGGELVVSDGEGVGWVGVDSGVLHVLEGVDAKSELVLLFGSEGESVLSHVSDEGLLDGRDWGIVLAHVGSEKSGGSAEVLHCKQIIIKTIQKPA